MVLFSILTLRMQHGGRDFDQDSGNAGDIGTTGRICVGF